MKRASPQMMSLAKLLMDSEAPRTTSVEVDYPTAFRTLDKMRVHLSMLTGLGGFQALLARALVRASADVPWLKLLRVAGDGELEGLTLAQATVDADDFSAGELVVLAELLGLLVTFIGPALTFRLINQRWPQLSFDNAEISNTANNEEAK